ncbi:unnamed protein product [Peniophora sp. CBMAI 1063]|nr:unnamed protein product [Peniophora sp. CBMAI 1063]
MSCPTRIPPTHLPGVGTRALTTSHQHLALYTMSEDELSGGEGAGCQAKDLRFALRYYEALTAPAQNLEHQSVRIGPPHEAIPCFGSLLMVMIVTIYTSDSCTILCNTSNCSSQKTVAVPEIKASVQLYARAAKASSDAVENHTCN